MRRMKCEWKIRSRKNNEIKNMKEDKRKRKEIELMYMIHFKLSCTSTILFTQCTSEDTKGNIIRQMRVINLD